MPVTRYRPLVDRLQFAIATGTLAPGTLLPSLRDGADEFGVHLHTVRRAYHELADLGLVRIDPRRGAVVLPVDGAVPSGLEALLRQTLAEAERRFGASPADVTAALAALRGATLPVVSVLECSRTLSGSIARQLAARWRIAATPRLVGAEAPPPGTVVSTYFHYREVSAALAQRPDDAAFLHIALAAPLLATLRRAIRAGTARRLIVCETDGPLGHEVAGVLRHALPGVADIDVVVPKRVTRIFGALGPREWALVSPRHWDRLDPAAPRPERVLLLDYDIDPDDLAQIGIDRRWEAR